MTRGRKTICVIVAVGVLLLLAFAILDPPVGQRLELPTSLPRLITISGWKPESIAITDTNRCREIVDQLRRARRNGRVHACPSLAVIRIEPTAGHVVELQVAPGHRVRNFDIFHGGGAYSLSHSAMMRVFELAESQ